MIVITYNKLYKVRWGYKPTYQKDDGTWVKSSVLRWFSYYFNGKVFQFAKCKRLPEGLPYITKKIENK